MDNGDENTNVERDVKATTRLAKRTSQSKDDSNSGGIKSQGETGAGDVADSDGAGEGSRTLFRINANEFVSALGFGLFMALLQLDFCDSVAYAQAPYGTLLLNAFVGLVDVFAFCVTCIACWVFSDQVSSLQSKRACTIGSFALALILLCECAIKVFGLDVWVLAALVNAADGIVFAFVLVAWISDLWVLERQDAVRVMFLSLCIAAALVVLMSILQTMVFRFLAMAVCLLLSGFSNMVARLNSGSGANVSREETRKNIKFDMSTSVAIFVVALAYGLCMSMTTTFGERAFGIIACAFLLAAVIISVNFFVIGEHGVLVSTVFRWMIPLLTAFLLVLSFASSTVLHVSTAVVIGACLTCMMSLFITLVQLKLRFTVQPVYVSARVCIPWAAGAFVGTLAFVVGKSLPLSAEVEGFDALPLLIVVMLSLATAIAPYGIDMLTMPIESDEDADVEEDETTSNHAWKSACDQIAREGQLTPRETEVFALLAKGRNAKVIERELFISVYTIKGHNNNIYRKLGVRSQQELIDLVERRRQELWKPVKRDEQGGVEHG